MSNSPDSKPLRLVWLRTQLQDTFLRGSLVLFVGMAIGNLFGYLFQISMGRQLTVAQFGELNAMMSMTIILSLPFTVVMQFFSQSVSALFAHQKMAQVLGFYRAGMIRLALMAALFLGLAALGAPWLGEYLNIEVSKILVMLCVIYFSVLANGATGVLQGLQLFGAHSVIGALFAVLKFLFALLLVWWGLGVYGALLGLVLASVYMLAHTHLSLRRQLPQTSKPTSIDLRDALKYLGGLFFANASMSLLMQVDLVLVRHYFTEEQSGLYASAAIMGKVVMYIPGALYTALFPIVAFNQAHGKSSALLLIKALGATLATSGTMALLIFLFPGEILELLFSGRYLGGTELTRLFGVAMLPMSLLVVVIHFLLAQKRSGSWFFLTLAVIFEVVAIHWYRDNLVAVLYIHFIAGMMALVPVSAHLVWVQWRKKPAAPTEPEQDPPALEG